VFWDSGKVESNPTIQVTFTGPALEPRRRYYWKVRVWDRRGEASRWSKTAWWEAALLSPGQWTAHWINDGKSNPQRDEQFYDDDTAEKNQDLKPYQYHGSAYGIAPAKRGFLKAVGEWNRQEVRCQDRHITVLLNGNTILDVDLDAAAPGGITRDAAAHPGLNKRQGHIGFLCLGDRVAFRNIRIQRSIRER
jgi:hypothetical protein